MNSLIAVFCHLNNIFGGRALLSFIKGVTQNTNMISVRVTSSHYWSVLSLDLVCTDRQMDNSMPTGLKNCYAKKNSATNNLQQYYNLYSDLSAGHWLTFCVGRQRTILLVFIVSPILKQKFSTRYVQKFQ